MRACVWLVEGTWQGCIDAAAGSIPADAGVVLLHVTPGDVAEAVEAAAAGRFGRAFSGHAPAAGSRRLRTRPHGILAAAAGRLGRPDAELVARRGRVEREVVSAVAEGSICSSRLATATGHASAPTAWATQPGSSLTTPVRRAARVAGSAPGGRFDPAAAASPHAPALALAASLACRRRPSACRPPPAGHPWPGRPGPPGSASRRRSRVRRLLDLAGGLIDLAA